MTIKEKRKKLYAFCQHNNCSSCVLGGKPHRCGRGTHFMIRDKDGMFGMSDAEIEVAFAIAFGDDATENIGSDSVNHPSHYNDGKIEVIDYIEDKKLGFCLGNAVKYISRAGKKDKSKEVEDLRKAIWYIERRISQIEAQ